MPVDALTIQMISAVAYLALSAGGLLLWLRRRSAASALVSFGFFALLLRELANLSDYFRFRALLRGHASADSFFLIHHHAALQSLALLGAASAGVGLIWHALSFTAKSPNQRLERP